MSIKTQPKERLAEIAAQLSECEDHFVSENRDHTKCGPPIERQMVVELIEHLRSIIFPGFQHAEKSDAHTIVQANLEEVHDLLCKLMRQMAKSNNWDDLCKSIDPDVVSLEYLSRLPQIRSALATDIQAAYDGDPACRNTDEVILCYPGLAAVTVYRLAHELHLLDVPLIPRMMAEWVHGETGIDIHPGAKIGKHFFIDHGTGVVIGETCQIGDNVKIYQGVTLGALSFPQDERGRLVRNTKRHPTIEDRVVIYANVTILGGNTTVGHDSVIGSSVWLTRSVDPFTTVVMEKPNLRLRNQTPSEFEPPLDFQI